MLLRLLQPRLKSFRLLGLGEIQEELADDDAIVTEIALKSTNVLEALLPDTIGD